MINIVKGGTSLKIKRFNMIMNPRILTTTWIIKKEWIKNTANIFEIHSFLKVNKLPVFIRRYIIYLYNYINKYDIIVGIRLFFNRKQFDIIISDTDRQALAYSFLDLFLNKNKKLHILNSIYFGEPATFKSKIKPYIYRPFIRNIHYIRVNSTKEITSYSKLLKIERNKFCFFPYPSQVKNPRIFNAEGDYIFSGGKQYRDYSTLIKAIKDTGYKLIIVSDIKSMKDVNTCDEVKVFYNISKGMYFDLLSKSKFVVVPLSNDFCSCGQIAFLDAMSYGKPVIVTKVTGSIDYIENGKTGLFYEKGNFMDLREKIILLSENQELRNAISHEAFIAVKNTFNHDMLVTKFCQFIDEKWKEKNDQ